MRFILGKDDYPTYWRTKEGTIPEKVFVCYFHFVKWSCLSLGLHIDVSYPNIEIHLPFGFIKIGIIYRDKIQDIIPLDGWIPKG